jgi:8-oxo-dGTP pyrophosphatase MutT (NUDIX family)
MSYIRFMMTFLEWIFENDTEHAAALRDTGFWGRAGAGAIMVAADSRRILLPHRSMRVEQPGTWGVWGGAMDGDENPAEAARREVEEEAGATSVLQMVPLYVFSKGDFRYHNFLAVVPHEFKPNLNWETQGYEWVEYGDWPSPMHFGLKALLDNSGREIEAVLGRLTSPKDRPDTVRTGS